MEMFLLECADCRCKYAIDNERFEIHNDEPWCPMCHSAESRDLSVVTVEGDEADGEVS